MGIQQISRKGQVHDIRYYPDPVLLKVAKPVIEFDDALRELIEDMFESMYAVDGCGLAAPQIGISKRISVIDTSRNREERIVLVNPEIIDLGDIEMMEEGCLSVPTVFNKVPRSPYAKIRAFDEYGEEYEMEGDGLLAEAFQHEIDHLNGKLFIQLLSPMKRNRAIKQLEKHKKKLAKQDRE